jgi:hypothetical protein
MDGPRILVASLTVPQPRGKSGARWQYHSRSDLHSKVACWGVCFDLIGQSGLLRKHIQDGKVVFGVNHEMRDFSTGRKKNLDLVISRPAAEPPTSARSLGELAASFDVVLDPIQQQKLLALPTLREGPVGAVLVALEAKAAMTEHGKARPRLYDELNSSHLTVHGASSQALAVGFVMVNASPTFVSPDLNKRPRQRTVVSKHVQPSAAASIIEKVKEIPRRTGPRTTGFDSLAIVVVSLANDGSPVSLVTSPPAPQPGDLFYYDNMVARVGNEYDTTFASI